MYDSNYSVYPSLEAWAADNPAPDPDDFYEGQEINWDLYDSAEANWLDFYHGAEQHFGTFDGLGELEALAVDEPALAPTAPNPFPPPIQVVDDFWAPPPQAAQPTPEQAFTAVWQQYQDAGVANQLDVQALYNGITGKKGRGKKEPEEMKTKFVFAYRNFSKSAKALAIGLGLTAPKRESIFDFFEYRRDGTYTLVNWGNHIQPGGLPKGSKIINEPKAVKVAGNKLHFFNKVKGKVRIPEYTTELSEALRWATEGVEVLARNTRGYGGKDIHFYSDGLEKFTEGEFWVQYKKKKDEYRVHVAFGEVIDVQKKAVRKTDHEGNSIDTSNIDFRVRNLENGFVFKREGIKPPQDVLDQAVLAVKTVELDFGAVDVIFNETEGKAYVLEVNCAPGLEGSTIDSYVKAIQPHL